jgi:hypothetical protein
MNDCFIVEPIAGVFDLCESDDEPSDAGTGYGLLYQRASRRKKDVAPAKADAAPVVELNAVPAEAVAAPVVETDAVPAEANAAPVVEEMTAAAGSAMLQKSPSLLPAYAVRANRRKRIIWRSDSSESDTPDDADASRADADANSAPEPADLPTKRRFKRNARHDDSSGADEESEEARVRREQKAARHKQRQMDDDAYDLECQKDVAKRAMASRLARDKASAVSAMLQTSLSLLPAYAVRANGRKRIMWRSDSSESDAPDDADIFRADADAARADADKATALREATEAAAKFPQDAFDRLCAAF